MIIQWMQKCLIGSLWTHKMLKCLRLGRFIKNNDLVEMLMLRQVKTAPVDTKIHIFLYSDSFRALGP